MGRLGPVTPGRQYWVRAHGKHVRLIVPKCTKVAEDARGSGVGAIALIGEASMNTRQPGCARSVSLCLRGGRDVPRVVVCGLYGDSCALLYPLDLAMPPAGRGCCNEHPLHPRVPRGCAPWTPLSSCTAFLSSPASLRRRAPSGDLPTGTRCALISRRLHPTWEPFPVPSSRRMCRRQSPASHASTRVTFSLNRLKARAWPEP